MIGAAVYGLLIGTAYGLNAIGLTDIGAPNGVGAAVLIPGFIVGTVTNSAIFPRCEDAVKERYSVSDNMGGQASGYDDSFSAYQPVSTTPEINSKTCETRFNLLVFAASGLVGGVLGSLIAGLMFRASYNKVKV